jgi:ParB/RepB/Spo0J family partition protein
LFDREPLDVLRDSIKKVGILVPLTVYWGSKERKYIILDGQRRWIAAGKLKLRDVPVNVVAEPSLVQNIVTMFQIHKLREDWELMPTALKLDVLMGELKESNEKRLAQLTGLDVAVVTRCKKLLSYPKKFQDLMLEPNPARRVKADFFIELYPVRTDRLVRDLRWFHKDQFTVRMLDRYREQKGIKAVTDFRMMKQHLSNARRADKELLVGRKLKEFVDDDSLGLEHLAVREANVGAEARKLTRAIDTLAGQVATIDVEEFFGEDALWTALQRLAKVVALKLQRAEKGRS